MVAVVAPLLHVPPPVLPDSVTVLPAQKVVAPPAVIVDATGAGFAVILIVLELTEPHELLLVTK